MVITGVTVSLLPNISKLFSEKLIVLADQIIDTLKTRMHSSRMRTICCSGRLGGGGVCLGVVSAKGCLPGGGGVCPGGVSPVDRQTPVKT